MKTRKEHARMLEKTKLKLLSVNNQTALDVLVRRIPDSDNELFIERLHYYVDGRFNSRKDTKPEITKLFSQLFDLLNAKPEYAIDFVLETSCQYSAATERAVYGIWKENIDLLERFGEVRKHVTGAIADPIRYAKGDLEKGTKRACSLVSTLKDSLSWLTSLERDFAAEIITAWGHVFSQLSDQQKISRIVESTKRAEKRLREFLKESPTGFDGTISQYIALATQLTYEQFDAYCRGVEDQNLEEGRST